MKNFLAPNIETKGRLIRAFMALIFFIGAAFGFSVSFWLGMLLAVSGAFTLFEAARGWCAIRACGVKTRF